MLPAPRSHGGLEPRGHTPLTRIAMPNLMSCHTLEELRGWRRGIRHKAGRVRVPISYRRVS